LIDFVDFDASVNEILPRSPVSCLSTATLHRHSPN